MKWYISSSTVNGLSFNNQGDTDQDSRVIVANNANERIDVKIKEENGTLAYNNDLDSNWKLYAELKSSFYIIEISAAVAPPNQDPISFRLYVGGCLELVVQDNENDELEANIFRCIGPVVDSLNKLGSSATFVNPFDMFK